MTTPTFKPGDRVRVVGPWSAPYSGQTGTVLLPITVLGQPRYPVDFADRIGEIFYPDELELLP